MDLARAVVHPPGKFHRNVERGSASIPSLHAAFQSDVLSLLAVADEVDFVPAVLRHQQRAVLSLQQTDGASPDVLVIGIHHETAEELFQRTSGLAIAKRKETDRITHPLRPIG